MNTLRQAFGIFVTFALVIGGCGLLPVQSRQAERVMLKEAVYEPLLGKPLTDDFVADFIAGNNCTRANQFHLCNPVGMALWIDSNQVVETVYLYLNNADGFAGYKGELPYGLKFYDIMGAVEYKLKKQGVGKAGLPDEGATPDHLRYRATYHRAGMTIIYNSPSPDDEDATIYAILINR